MATLKKYYSPLRNFCTEGISFTTLGAPEVGSYIITSSKEVQDKLESSPMYRRVFKSVPFGDEEKAAEKAAEENKSDGKATYGASTLQEARDTIMKLRAEKGMAYKTFPNTKAVLNAADELGVEFPNLRR